MLTHLRKTRQRGVRRWGDEGDGERLLAAARATEALHRPMQALVIYRLVIDADAEGDIKHSARQAIARLTKEA